MLEAAAGLTAKGCIGQPELSQVRELTPTIW
jgi:hypothetical protein